MRLPLIVGARPSVAKRGPIVNLSDGEWRVIVENLRDSVLRIYYNSLLDSYESIISTCETKCTFIGPCKVQVEIASPGSERDIHVFAELLNAA
jgi:hypothetical protein